MRKTPEKCREKPPETALLAERYAAKMQTNAAKIPIFAKKFLRAKRKISHQHNKNAPDEMQKIPPPHKKKAQPGLAVCDPRPAVLGD